LDDVLKVSDVVSLHCPLLPETEGMVNANFIAKMKDSAILLNTARGALINEADVAEALHTGKISAAGLDVLTKEPPKANNPLLSLENCIITPHIAWASKAARERLIETVVGNVKGFMEGKIKNNVW
jgi:glycerate dehydrogenase